MKLCMVVRSFVPTGGMGRYATSMAGELARQGHTVHVVCQRSTDDNVGGQGCKSRVAIEKIRPGRLRGLPGYLAFARRARRAAALSAAELSLAIDRVPGLDIFRAGGGCHASYLGTLERGRYSVRNMVELELDRRAAREASRVVANAPLPAAQLTERYRLEPRKVVVIPNGVDTILFRPSGRLRTSFRREIALDEGRPLVLFLGSGFARKGLSTAISAVSRLDGAVLAVLGADRYSAAFRQQASRLGTEVIFLGLRQDVARVLAAADAMVLPTLYDSASNAVLEAMAAGVPPVTSGANGAAAFLPEPWMVVNSAHDVPGFAMALERALSTPGLGEICRSTVKTMTWHKSCKALVQLSREVLAERAG